MHAILRIRPNQESGWKAFEAASMPSPSQIAKLRANAERMASVNTLQRLELIDQSMAIQESMFHRSAEATRRFYALLSPDQQRTFDQVTMPRVQAPRPH